MTETQALALKDIFYRVKQFYYGVSDKSQSAMGLTAGEASEYIAAMKEAEASLLISEEGKQLAADAPRMLSHTCRLVREALVDKNIRLAGDLAALGVRLIGVYTFPAMGRKRFWERCMTPFREKHGDGFYAELEAEFLGGAPTALRLSPSFARAEGRYYEDDADEAFKLAHPIVYGVFVFLGIVCFFGSIVGFGLVAGMGLSLSSPYLLLGYLGAAMLGVGLYSLVMTLTRQYMGHLLTLFLTLGGVAAMVASLLLAV